MEPFKAPTKRGRGEIKVVSSNNRRVWTNLEEQALIVALKDLVTHGWKNDNGFRTGYLNKLEDAIKAAFPGTDLRANPNITSKLTTWKKSYGSLVTALRDNTGARWNTTTNTLEVTNDQWEDIVRKDPTMRRMRTKEWHLYHDWVEIFGKGRATGEAAEDVTIAVEKTCNQPESPIEKVSQDFNDDNFVNVEEPSRACPVNSRVNEDDGAYRSAHTTAVPQPSVDTSSKKKKRTESSEPSMASLLGDFNRTIGDFLEKIVHRIGHDHDMGLARQKLFEQLGNIPSLSLVDKIVVSEILGANPNQHEIFMGYTDEARAVYCSRLLERERK